MASDACFIVFIVSAFRLAVSRLSTYIRRRHDDQYVAVDIRFLPDYSLGPKE